jgi:magnesium-transporting ATPase (P-type)
MRRPPRDPREALLSGLLLVRLVYVSAASLIATFGVFWWLESAGASLEEARTAAVGTLVAAEMWYLFGSRRFRDAAFSRRSREGMRPALIATGLVLLAQFAFTHLPPMQVLFRTHDLDAFTWLVVLLAGTLPLLAVEAEKALRSALRAGPRDSVAAAATSRG